MIRVNGRPLHLVEPQCLRFKLEEPILLLGRDKFNAVDIRIRVKGGGHVAQTYGKKSFFFYLYILINRDLI